MAATYTQEIGYVRFGLTANSLVDVHDDVIKCRFVKTRDMAERGPTLGSPRKTPVALGYKEEIVVDFYALGSNATETLDGLIKELMWAATPTSAPTLYFEFRQQQAATGESNPKITGTCLVLEGSYGGDASTLRQETVTFPVTNSTISES